MNTFNPDRLFSPDPAARDMTRELYQTIATLPIVSPHGHIDPCLFSDPNATFGTPAELFIIPDHYFTRMLCSQGIPLEILLTGDHREICRLFCKNFHLFRGTPSGIWLKDELSSVFDIDEKPSASNAGQLFDTLSEKLSSIDFSPANSSNGSTSKSFAPLMQRQTLSNITKLSKPLAGTETFAQLSAQTVWSTSMRQIGKRTLIS